MAYVWAGMLVCGLAALLAQGGGDAAVASLLSSSGEAVTLCLELSGGYLLFLGLLGIARKARLMDALSRRLSGAVRYLFPRAGKAAGAITLCLSANVLGLGNAATPFGLEAMRQLDESNPCPGTATDEMCVLVAVNASALQLLPTGLIALRQAAGSTAPAAIVLPSLLASAAATLVAVVLCRLCVKKAQEKSPCRPAVDGSRGRRP